MRHIIICGQAPLSFIHPPEAEVWVINGPHFPPRWDVLFQLHGDQHIRQKHGQAFLSWLLGANGRSEAQGAGVSPFGSYPEGALCSRVRVIRPPGMPEGNGEPYPLREIREGLHSGYLNNSFPLAIAYALWTNSEPALRLWLDGVMYGTMSDGWEPPAAVACIEFWLGRAEGMGCIVRVPPGSGLLEPQPHVYGFEGPGSV